MISTMVAQVLALAKDMGVDRLDAQLLLCHELSCSRSWLLAHDDAALSAREFAAVQAGLRRRADDEPLAYLLGEKEFHGLALSVNSSVLVPRPETEGLVDWGLELLAGPLADIDPARVADLGTGSGAIALALKRSRPTALVTATDASLEALAVARGNSVRLGLDIQFLQGDWWECLVGQEFHLVLSNPPYIEPGDPHLHALRHEPRSALTPGRSGIDALAEIIDGAAEHMTRGGWLLLEHGHDQGDTVQALLLSHGFSDPQTRRDLAGLSRCTGAQRG